MARAGTSLFTLLVPSQQAECDPAAVCNLLTSGSGRRSLAAPAVPVPVLSLDAIVPAGWGKSQGSKNGLISLFEKPLGIQP